MTFRPFARAAFAFAAFLAAVPAFAAPEPPPVDQLVERAMKAFNVPGLAIAVVKDGAVVTAKGYGVRRLGDSAEVDGQTLFPIASNSKAFTAVAIAILVDEGRIGWDAPVSRYLPWFQMADPYVTRELTVRDLLSHRSGLGEGAGDLLLFPPTTYDRKEIARRVRYLPLASSFRAKYAYDNILYVVAAELVEAVSGMTWEEFIDRRILNRLRMASSSATVTGARNADNRASPHAVIDGAQRPIAPMESEAANSSGGIISNAQDMSRWLRILTLEGRAADLGRLYSLQASTQLMTLVTPMSVGPAPPELAALQANFRGYGLGFVLQDFRGRKIAMHTGGLPGYSSRLTLVPELGLGVVVMANQEALEACGSITFAILDHYLQASPPVDWVKAYQMARERYQERAAERVRTVAATKKPEVKPTLALARYAGIYTDAWYGDVEITSGEGGLAIRFTRTPQLTGTLEHWAGDIFVARWRDRALRADAFVNFYLDTKGEVHEAAMRPFSEDADFNYDFQDLRLRPASGRSR